MNIGLHILENQTPQSPLRFFVIYFFEFFLFVIAKCNGLFIIYFGAAKKKRLKMHYQFFTHPSQNDQN